MRKHLRKSNRNCMRLDHWRGSKKHFKLYYGTKKSCKFKLKALVNEA